MSRGRGWLPPLKRGGAHRHTHTSDSELGRKPDMREKAWRSGVDRRSFLAASGGGAAAPAYTTAASADRRRDLGPWGWQGRQANGTHISPGRCSPGHIQFVTTEADAYANPYATGVLIGHETAKLGFPAVDLTVRSGGFVDPSMVQTNLPPMVQGIRSTGVTCDQITAGIRSDQRGCYDPPRDGSTRRIRSYRFGNYKYSTTSPPPFGRGILEELESFRPALLDLQEVNRRLGLLGFYYTFSGTNVGASTWDMIRLLRPPVRPALHRHRLCLSPPIASSATGNWVTSLESAMPFVRGISLGDTMLVQTPGGASDVGAFPGRGIVNWKTFFTPAAARRVQRPAERVVRVHAERRQPQQHLVGRHVPRLDHHRPGRELDHERARLLQEPGHRRGMDGVPADMTDPGVLLVEQGAPRTRRPWAVRKPRIGGSMLRASRLLNATVLARRTTREVTPAAPAAPASRPRMSGRQ